MNIAANLSLLFTGLPLGERIAAAAAAGFDGVEVQFPYELPATQFQEALERSGLPLVLFNLPAGDLMEGGAGLAAVPARQAEFDAALEQALDYARQAPPLCINVLPGRRAAGVSREQALDTLVANLRKAADAFQELGVTVLFEAINPLDMPGFLINTPAHLRQVLDRVDHPNCQVQLDIYHMARHGIAPDLAIEQLAGAIGHVQFADYPGRGAPGTGSIPFDLMFKALAHFGYTGWLGAEYRSQDSGQDLAWLSYWRLQGVAGS